MFPNSLIMKIGQFVYSIKEKYNDSLPKIQEKCPQFTKLTLGNELKHNTLFQKDIKNKLMDQELKNKHKCERYLTNTIQKLQDALIFSLTDEEWTSGSRSSHLDLEQA